MFWRKKQTPNGKIQNESIPPDAREHLEAPEDLTAKAHNTEVARRMANMGLGIYSVMAQQWLNRFEEDETVPAFGVRPYWTPTGQQGLPEVFLPLAFWSVKDRIKFVSTAEISDVQFILNDPHPEVRIAAYQRARLLGFSPGMSSTE